MQRHATSSFAMQCIGTSAPDAILYASYGAQRSALRKSEPLRGSCIVVSGVLRPVPLYV